MLEEGNTYLLYGEIPTEFAVLKTQPTTKDGAEVHRCGLSNKNAAFRKWWGLFPLGLWNLQ